MNHAKTYHTKATECDIAISDCFDQKYHTVSQIAEYLKRERRIGRTYNDFIVSWINFKKKESFKNRLRWKQRSMLPIKWNTGRK